MSTNQLELLRIVSEAAAAAMLGVSSDTLKRNAQRDEARRAARERALAAGQPVPPEDDPDTAPRRIRVSARRVGYRISDVLEWLERREREPSFRSNKDATTSAA